MGAAPASATESPVPGTPLPDTLAPVTIPHQTTRAKRPRVMAARVTPRRVRHGHRSRLRVALATPGSMRVTIHRRVGKRHVKVSERTVAAPLAARVLRLPARLRRGHYRITVVAVDPAGKRSRAVHRALAVI